MSTHKSEELFRAAQALLPGGVDSPVRAFRSVGGTPRFIARGEGPFLVDADRNRLVDFVLAWGPLILGHAHPDVVKAVGAALAKGTAFGAPTEAESELAKRVIKAFPSIGMVRFVSSGTEATMSALRLARAFTGRAKIVKFDGCYHGHADALLVKAGSGVATLGLPDSPGVPEGAAKDTLVAPYNDLQAVERLCDANHGSLAAIIVEPVAGNMGVVPPAEGFLQGLRELAAAAGALLIFDEVMTGWRVHPAGAQVLYGVQPDLTCLGKVIGGGLPVGAYGGRRELMEMVAPAGPVYQAGTLSGNPLAMAAGIATLDTLAVGGAWHKAEAAAAAAAKALADAAQAAGAPLVVQRVGTMFTPFFTDRPVTDFATAKTSDTKLHASFFHAMLDAGVYLPPSQFEAAFTSVVHGAAEIEQLAAGAERALAASGFPVKRAAARR
ncbi:MAG TPA: glutamate-1-semialdehyde 2,1-aminomutase [Gemmatimonadales bacterium]|nr:glutamate-1-semialdehyde 2,1-aminomutase [Gemmatimonadales bacterium]